jgi:hypothetical protein
VTGSNSVEVIAGPFAQAGGANSIGVVEIARATYTLSGGTLAVVNTFNNGDEFVGLGNASGGFIQSGGTHIIARSLQIGSSGSGTYVLSAGLLSMPVSGPFAFDGFGEFIGENTGAVATFILDAIGSLKSVYRLRISGPANDPILTGRSTEEPHFFGVTSGGSGSSNYTTLTLSSGSPIAQALGFTQSASALGNGASFTGAGIKIGIISDSFNFNAATGKEAAVNTGAAQADINNGLLPSGIVDLATGSALFRQTISGHPQNPQDEGRAMAEIIHAIAPQATIVFQTPDAEPEAATDQLGAFAHAVKDLQGNPQLKTQSFKLESLIQNCVVQISGETSAMQGKGLLNGFAAVSGAAGLRTDFFDPLSSSGPTLLAAAISQPFGSVATGTLVQFQLTFDEALKISGTPTRRHREIRRGGVAAFQRGPGVRLHRQQHAAHGRSRNHRL